jgi:hypothetical protein
MTHIGPHAPPPDRRSDPPTVLYLDVDDTLINWANYEAKPARGMREFLEWALARFEVRWLTRRCPSGEMPGWLVEELCGMAGLPAERLMPVRGVDWESCESKINGIAWLEHLVLGRPFLWVEDDNGVGEPELRFLERHGVRERYHHCNVSMDPDALLRVHALLREQAAGPTSGG